MLEIVTNHHWRELTNFYEMSEKDRDDFDYLTEDQHYEARFFKYKDTWYDAFDFISTSPGPWNHGLPAEFRQWDGYINDTAWTGILLLHSSGFRDIDDDMVMVAYFISKG